MTAAVPERVCERAGCGQPVTGRADKRFCSDACRNAANRSRADRIGSASRLATVTAIRTGAALAWEPASEPLSWCETDEPCPGCGAMLRESPRGNLTVCTSCREVREPPAAAAAYAATGSPAAPRQVAGDQERRAAEDELVRRKGELLAGLAALAASPQLAPASAYPVEWLTGKVRKAGSLAALGELAARAGALGIRQRDAALEDDVDDGEVLDGEVLADDRDSGETGSPAAPVVLSRWGLPLALPARPQPPRQVATPEDALAVLGLMIPLVSSVDGCQVAEDGVRCGAETRFPIEAHGREVWLCTRHNYAVCKVLRTAGRSA